MTSIKLNTPCAHRVPQPPQLRRAVCRWLAASTLLAAASAHAQTFPIVPPTLPPRAATAGAVRTPTQPGTVPSSATGAATPAAAAGRAAPGTPYGSPGASYSTPSAAPGAFAGAPGGTYGAAGSAYGSPGAAYAAPGAGYGAPAPAVQAAPASSPRAVAGPCRVSPSPERQVLALVSGEPPLPREQVALGEFRAQQVIHSPDGRWAVAFTKLRGAAQFAALAIDLERCAAQRTFEIPGAGSDASFQGDEVVLRYEGGERRVSLRDGRVR